MPHQPQQSSHTRSVLLADCHDDTRAMYRAYLQHERWTVEEAQDGRVALAFALSTAFDVVVAEAMLPGMSGIELCAALRADHATATLPFVLLTADARPQTTELALACGVDRVLVKPCMPEQVRTELEGVVGDRRDGAVSRPAGTARRAAKAGLASRDARVYAPPALVCPHCSRPLVYDCSRVGGVGSGQPEQWDYYACPGGCGDFQYRHRTRRLRTVARPWAAEPPQGRRVG